MTCRERKALARGGFTLVEVVLAVAIFAGSLLTLLALWPLATRQEVESTETVVALGLADAARLELDRLAVRRGFDVLAAQIAAPADEAEIRLLLVAARTGGRVRVLGEAEPESVARFFVLEPRHFPAGPLGYSAGDAHLAVRVRVSWPYATEVGVTRPEDRRATEFTLVLNR